ncbi:YdeI/OmpD-associated family protein [Devosia rhizoryzae]|uniref:YdeI/OmpD-associated family protein n=1 Tax=Devosia rhizoryzae TaxID=2774137 RepID=A0ABX7C3S6_9HYPH|nr:YdeI/OmpD-associated family protein [Devosia rhizoryzae]QQR38881.1 YdeI/OmpD-associated family protein [Devosia rhizoryzae]
MAPVEVRLDRLHEFADFDAFYTWLEKHHDVEDEVWIHIFKKASGKPTITPIEAIDAVLCWGWIDAIKKSWDDESFVQRYCRRRPKSVWSQVNRDNVERLLQSNLMTAHGMVHVEAAKADGRWDAAYATTMEPPEDLMAAIRQTPGALAMFDRLSSQNRFALIFRTNALKTAAAREKKIEAFAQMLARGETIYPQKAKP